MSAAPIARPGHSNGSAAHVAVQDLLIAYGSKVIQQDLNFAINRGDIFVIMGGSGCGKSTLMFVLIGMKQPAKGSIVFNGEDFWQIGEDRRDALMRRAGVTYQRGALWSSMTLAENVALPLQQYTGLSPKQIRELVSYKLSLVGLAGFEEYYPAEISGGMQKRAGLARAMALDPEILFFDEPSAGLDPVTSRRLDDLILELRDTLDATVVIVTHELPSIFAIGNNSVFLDPETKTQLATGSPKTLLAECDDPKVRSFLTRGGSDGTASP